MNVIFVGRKSGRVKQFDLQHPVIMSIAGLLVLAIVGTAFSIGVGLGARHGSGNPIDQLGNWSAELLRQKGQIEDTKRVLQEKVNALAMRVGQMNANVIRLDALGKRLTRMANLDDGEFDFGHPPALGGAESGVDGQPAQIPSLTAMVDDLQTQLSSREQQLGVLGRRRSGLHSVQLRADEKRVRKWRRRFGVEHVEQLHGDQQHGSFRRWGL